jgi:hypothetical protein
MNLFLASVYVNNYMPNQNRHIKLTDIEKNIFIGIPNILESYHYCSKQVYVNIMRDQGAKVFLDSGAFSAHSLKVTIDINAYCDYIIRNKDILRVEDGAVMASVLDGIGDPQKTYENQLWMEKKGAKPLPCYHFGEDPRWLEHYVNNYEYITIGGLVGRSAKDQEVWLDRVWNNHMLDGSGRPKLKVHGFGMTSPNLMKRYPWYSCDSSSWIQSASYGSIYTSEYGPISVSKDSPSRHEAGRHLTTLTPIERQSVESMLARKGFNLERLESIYESRAAYSCLGYQELNILVNNNAERTGGRFQVSKAQQLF